MRKILFFFTGLLCCLSSYALKPSPKYLAIPDTLKLPFEKNTITTTDNVKLQSWTFRPDKGSNNHTTLVLAYADAGNMSWWLSQATILSQSGFTVVMFDYRGFGESDPFKINPQMLYYNEFATDLAAVFKFAKGKYPRNKTGVWAFSMGTIVTTLASRYITPDFVIADGLVTDPAAIKAFYNDKKDPILLPAGAAGYGSTLRNMKQPMLVFSGKKDQVTTEKAISTLKKTNPGISVISFNGGHMEGFSVLSKNSPDQNM